MEDFEITERSVAITNKLSNITSAPTDARENVVFKLVSDAEGMRGVYWMLEDGTWENVNRAIKQNGTTTSSATPTINTDKIDFYSLTAQAVNITSFTSGLSGTPVEGQTLWLAIIGTASITITWGTSFEASTVPLPTTTNGTNRLDVGFIWNSVSSKWRCIATA